MKTDPKSPSKSLCDGETWFRREGFAGREGRWVATGRLRDHSWASWLKRIVFPYYLCMCVKQTACANVLSGIQHSKLPHTSLACFLLPWTPGLDKLMVEPINLTNIRLRGMIGDSDRGCSQTLSWILNCTLNGRPMNTLCFGGSWLWI